MYIVTVPNVTIYLDRELWTAVRTLDISPSGVCQRALRQAVARARIDVDRERTTKLEADVNDG